MVVQDVPGRPPSPFLREEECAPSSVTVGNKVGIVMKSVVRTSGVTRDALSDGSESKEV